MAADVKLTGRHVQRLTQEVGTDLTRRRDEQANRVFVRGVERTRRPADEDERGRRRRGSGPASWPASRRRLSTGPATGPQRPRRPATQRTDGKPSSRCRPTLRPFLKGKPSAELLWPGTWRLRAYKMIAADLAEARAAWIAEAADDAEESDWRKKSDFLAYHADARTADFHATRHSYITLLARSGVHPKTAQNLARHKSIDLTMNHYTHLQLRDHGAALKGMPSLAGAAEKQPLRVTGTDGAYTPLTQIPDGERGRTMADDGKETGKGVRTRRTRPLENEGF